MSIASKAIVVGGLLAVTPLSGCGFGTHDTMLMVRSRDDTLTGRSSQDLGWLSAEAKKSRRLLYVADQPGQKVYVFTQMGQNQSPIGEITQGIGGPDGLFVDSKRNLYVCNFGLATITVYPLGHLMPSRTLTQAGSSVIDVVVGLDGTVYASNFNEGSNGQIIEYANGSTTPTTIINLTGYPEGLALDSHNNLYAAYQKTPNAGTVLEFAPGSTMGKDLNLPIVSAGGATIDQSDNLIVADQGQARVDVFPPGSKMPSKIYSFPLAFDIALNAFHDHLYVTQPVNPPTVWEIQYPQGNRINAITNAITSAYGVATSPDGSN